jgi:hypothetical protein
MSLSATARAPVRVGFPTINDGSAPVLAAREQRPALTAEELAFARRVRPGWWRSCSPAILAFLFGAALVLVAGAAPPSVTVQRMLSADGDRGLAAEQSVVPGTGADYVLPRHLQWPEWPSLSSTAEGNGPLACDPAGPDMGC